MISLTIKVLNGDLFEVSFDPRRSMDALYRLVWDALPEQVKPRFIWQMMLIKQDGADGADGEFIRPTRVPMRPLPRIRPVDGDVLLAWFEPITYVDVTFEDTLELDDDHYYDHVILRFTRTIDHDGRDFSIIFDHRDQNIQRFYLEDEVKEVEGGWDMPEHIGHHDPMDIVDYIDRLSPATDRFSPVAKEILYQKLYDILRGLISNSDDLVPDCPIYDFVNDLDVYPPSEDEAEAE